MRNMIFRAVFECPASLLMYLGPVLIIIGVQLGYGVSWFAGIAPLAVGCLCISALCVRCESAERRLPPGESRDGE